MDLQKALVRLQEQNKALRKQNSALKSDLNFIVNFIAVPLEHMQRRNVMAIVNHFTNVSKPDAERMERLLKTYAPETYENLCDNADDKKKEKGIIKTIKKSILKII